jgi:hypothetical protein
MNVNLIAKSTGIVRLITMHVPRLNFMTALGLYCALTYFIALTVRLRLPVHSFGSILKHFCELIVLQDNHEGCE